MPIGFLAYKDIHLVVMEGTLGGSTYTVAGNDLCFAYTRSHYRTVRALTDGESKDLLDIKDRVVDNLIAIGDIEVDDEDCLEDYGWLGCVVWDGDGSKIGVVGSRCSLLSGFGTDHVGTGRCKHHGGAGIHSRIAAKMTHGLTSKHTRASLEKKVNDYLKDPSPLDLSRELATQRALLDELLTYITGQGDMAAFADRIPDLMRLQDMIGKQVDRIVSIEARYALTASQVMYVQVTVSDVISKYLVDPIVREAAAAELAERLGTSAAAAMPNRIMSLIEG